MRPIEQRQLGAGAGQPSGDIAVWAFADAGETADQVIARQFPDGLPDRVALVIYCCGRPRINDQ